MKKVSEYLQHAQECRALAATMKTGEQREQLLKMAEMWEQLSEDRSGMMRQHPEMDRAPDASSHDEAGPPPSVLTGPGRTGTVGETNSAKPDAL